MSFQNDIGFSLDYNALDRSTRNCGNDHGQSAGFLSRLAPIHIEAPVIPTVQTLAATLDITLINDVEPLSDRPSGTEIAPVPPTLEAVLFGGAGKLYAVLDSALVTNLAARLDAGDLPHICLFAEDHDDSAETAPWLVALERGDDLLRQLFTTGDAAWLHWTDRVGLFLRSDLDLAALRTHLRRFLRVQDHYNRWFFFRFWEPLTAPAYFGNIADRPEMVTRWFCPREGGRISALMALDGTAGTFWVATPRDLPDNPASARGTFTLTRSDLDCLQRARTEQDLGRLSDLLARTFPAKTAGMDSAALQEFTRETVRRMRGYGFAQKDHIFKLLAWELHFGPNLESRDPDGELARICTARLDEASKFVAFEDRINTFGPRSD